ncbi:MAG: MG2 domain-containing protein [Reichenbachiella sp.]|uniref:alpha-2-macroglobulin family protein n=1 Tax=Reichenbachiella sp. TaxID=2184521 RepID=UPI00326613A9
MKFKPTQSLACVILIFVLFGCGSDGSVKLIDTNFDTEINLKQNLNFVFDKPLVGDTVLQIWDTTQYIVFEPKISGRFKWSSESVLIFSPSEGFNPATSYTASFTKLMTSPSGFSLSGDQTITFATAILKLESVSPYWKETQNGQTNAHLELYFNAPAEGIEIAELTKVFVDDKETNIERIETSDPRVLTLYLPKISLEDKDLDIDVQLEKGLTAKGGNLTTQEAIVQSVLLRSPYSVNIEDVVAEHNGVEGTVTVEISQEAANDAEKFVVISPKVDYDLKFTESGLKIVSEDFDLSKKYSLTLKAGLKGKFGGALKADHLQDISFGKLRPEISFVSSAMYLSKKGAQNLEVKIINVEKVKISITKLYENNVLAFMRDKEYDYDKDEYGYNFYNLGLMGDVIYEKEVLSKSLPKNKGYRVLNLNVEDKIKDYNGMYAIKVTSNEAYWLRDEKLLTVSDLGLVAKEGKNDVAVFVNSLKSAEPQAGVNLRFIGRNNQLLGEANTDANGLAIFSKPENPSGNFKVQLITAQLGDDYNLMAYDNSAVNTSKFEVGGKYPNGSGYDVFLYGDRDIYRPGETINVSGVIRDDNWQKPEQIPVKVVFQTPDGREYKTVRKTLNAHGAFEVSHDLSPSAQTGSHNIQVYTANNVYLSSRSIRVEEFMPDRIKVEVDIDKTDIDIDEKAMVDVTAVNYFGPPAANRNYEVSISARKKYYYTRDFSEFNFSINGSNEYFRTVNTSGKTDENGKASYEYQLAKEYSNMGMVKADVFVTVFDETGRPVNSKRTVNVSTQDVYYGIARDRYYAATNSEMKFAIVALDKDKKVLSGVKTRLQLIKHEYRTVLSRSGGYFRYNSERVEKVIEDKQITIGGKDQTYSFIPEISGRYELRLSKPGVRNYVSSEVYAYGWGGTSNSSFEVNSEGQIDIQLDKDQYQPGDQAKVILKSPFSGKILVTVETDKVLKHFYVQADKRASSFTLDIEESFVPNVYITATLFKPHAKSDLPLTIAHGIAPVMVDNPQNKIPLEVTAVEKSRSKTKQKITIKSAPNSAVTVAVVDEGILSLTGYKTPDPYSYFYRKRALGVSSYDIYPLLFPEIEIVKGRIGGDGSLASEMDKRVNPMNNNRVKLVSFWSGLLETDDNGEVTYEIDIPQFSGSLRVMALSHKDHTFASSAQPMQVADPIVISTALPRFLSPGDTALVPVNISNTTDKQTTAQTSISVTGEVDIVGPSKLKAAVQANAENVVNYKIVARQAIGQANITVDVNALGENFKNSTDMSVRPAAPLQKEYSSGLIKAGNTKEIDMGATTMVESSLERKLVVSSSPLITMSEDLDYLVRYPHGCVEQTISSAFPQLYYQDLVKELYGSEDEVNHPQRNVMAAIQKLKGMQLHHGGLTYWPGRGYESWWGSVYAAHFLHEAQKAGFEVDQSMMDKLLNYLVTKLKTRETTYYYFNNTQRTIASKEIAYSLYVLAMAGKPQRSTMNYYKSRQRELALDSKYLLAASYAHIGDDNSFRKLLPPDFTGEKSRSAQGGSFYSYIRDQGIALNVLIDVDEDNPQIASMIKRLSKEMKSRRYMSTQERVFGFLALGKVARNNAGSNVTAEVKVGGKTVAEFTKKTLKLTSDQLIGGKVTISTSGQGNLYYFWEMEGIPVDGSYKEEDSFIRVRKSFYDRRGRQITSGKFKQNDLIVVKLSISSKSGELIENVAMTDMLPAGFEIENSRISDVPTITWIKDGRRPDYLDVRDDRISYFINLRNTGIVNYYYIVRAVSKGTFQMGPVGADAMYDGEYHSYSGGGTVVVE